MTFSVGETLQAGKYRLDALLEERQWGMTFLATHLGVDQPVLIKTFQATDTVSGPSRIQVDSFIRYAKNLTRFHHPQLSRVSNAFDERQCACMVSEFIDGEPLSQLIQETPLPEAIARQYIGQVAQGLHALHRHGLLHLNLRPSRILKRKDDGGIVLIGLNSRFSNHPDEKEGQPYFAPEQSEAAEGVKISSEIYGVSATLYTLVTGMVPVAASDRSQTPLISPRQLCPSLSSDIEAAILSGLALDSRDRPQTMKAWLNLFPNVTPVPAPVTTLQVPPSWKVKLPAFRDAGFNNSVSTTITPESEVQGPTATTTLQPPSSEPILTTNVPNVDPAGHPELDSILVEMSEATSTSIAPQTSLQVKDGPQVKSESEVTSAPTPSVSLQPTDALPAASQSIDSESQVAIPLQSSESQPPPIASQTLPDPVLVEAIAPTQPDVSDMTTTFPKKSRFPKWTLFWCALVAACGGLGAGLWFRVHLAQQFASPGPSIEQSPLDELRSLDTKEEKFLPTNSSVIPEETSEENGDYTDSNIDTDFEQAPVSDYNASELNADVEADPDGAVEEFSPWNASDRARERLSRESSPDADFADGLEESEVYRSDNVEVFESNPDLDEDLDSTIDSRELDNTVVVPDTTEILPDESFSSNYDALDPDLNRL